MADLLDELLELDDPSSQVDPAEDASQEGNKKLKGHHFASVAAGDPTSGMAPISFSNLHVAFGFFV